jgi:hypothetical protein
MLSLFSTPELAVPVGALRPSSYSKEKVISNAWLTALQISFFGYARSLSIQMKIKQGA